MTFFGVLRFASRHRLGGRPQQQQHRNLQQQQQQQQYHHLQLRKRHSFRTFGYRGFSQYLGGEQIGHKSSEKDFSNLNEQLKHFSDPGEVDQEEQQQQDQEDHSAIESYQCHMELTSNITSTPTSTQFYRKINNSHPIDSNR